MRCAASSDGLRCPATSARRRKPRRTEAGRPMFSNFDFDVIIRSLPYLFLDGMTFTLMLTALATVGGILFGTLLALMRLSGIVPLPPFLAGSVPLIGSCPLSVMSLRFLFPRDVP